MKKLCYLFTVLLAVTFAACENGGPESPSNPNQPFNPSKPEKTANGHGYVDLGLSVKWATCNVGANTPEEFGDYFAWGETQPKEVYNDSTYKYYKHNGYNSVGYAEYKVTKYCTDSDYGTVDNKTVLDLEDDAAHVNWGGAWRMPTMEEQQELRDNCTWICTVQNGIIGHIAKSEINGNSIFLPLTGIASEEEGGGLKEINIHYAGAWGMYWGSSTDWSMGGKVIDLRSDGGNWNYDDYNREVGLPIRPVLP